MSDGNPDQLFIKLRAEMWHCFGWHNFCEQDCGADLLGGIIIPAVTGGKIKERWNKTYLSVSQSLILNKNTNMSESVNNIQNMHTGGKRKSMGGGDTYRYRFAATVIHWNEGDTATEYFRESGWQVPPSYASFCTFRQKKRERNNQLRKERRRRHKKYDNGSLEYGSAASIASEDLKEDVLEEERKRFFEIVQNLEHHERQYTRWDIAKFHRLKLYKILPESFPDICTFVTSSPETRAQHFATKVLKECYSRLSNLTFTQNLEAIDEVVGMYKEKFPTKFVTCQRTVFQSRAHPFLACLCHAIVQDTLDSTKGVLFCKKLNEDTVASSKQKLVEFKQGSQPKLSKKSPDYLTIQGYMAITGLDYCEAVLWAKLDFHKILIPFDANFWEKRQSILTDFFYFMAMEKIDSRKLRGLPQREYKDVKELVESQSWRSWP